MTTDSLLWLAFILILVEYIFRLRRSVPEKTEQRFEKLKAEFIKKQGDKMPLKVTNDPA